MSISVQYPGTCVVVHFDWLKPCHMPAAAKQEEQVTETQEPLTTTSPKNMYFTRYHFEHQSAGGNGV